MVWITDSPNMTMDINPLALRTAKTLLDFGHFECSRVKQQNNNNFSSVFQEIAFKESAV